MSPAQTTSAPIDVKVDGQTAESWSEIIAQFDDSSVYQTWAYGAVRWGEKNLSHLVLRQGGQIVAAAQLRIARIPLLPVGVAYLRWGPLCQKKGQTLESAVVQAMVAQLKSEYGRRRGLVLQIIPNAYLAENRGSVYSEAFKHAELCPQMESATARTIVVELSEAPEVIRKRLDQKWRNQLNGAEKKGLVLEVSDGALAYQEFIRLYDVMWERKQFETSVDVQEFARIQELLSGPAKMQTFLARKDGVAVAALVCSLMGNTAIYLLGATNDQARELKAAYFLQWQAMLWLKEHGALRYDLGGIDPIANPGGYHFKSGFGGTDVTQLPVHSGGGNLFSRGVTAFIGRRRQRSAAAKVPAQASLAT